MAQPPPPVEPGSPLVTDYNALDRPESLPSRTAFDDLLLTAATRTTHLLAS